MKKLLIINSSANTGSTGRIAEEIGQAAIDNGFESYFGYGRTGRESTSHLIKIGDDWNIKFYGVKSLILDAHGFGSLSATKKFINEIERIKPDIINIHNLHGYYINIEILLEYLARTDIPIVFTLHDCWTYTGHCAHYMRLNCEKWKAGCYNCPNSKAYPKSLFLDRSKYNYEKKRNLFTSLNNVTIVCPSKWLEKDVRQSYLQKFDVRTIYNGTDVSVFMPQESKRLQEKIGIVDDCKVILGVASVWTKNKGLYDFYELSKTFNKSNNYQIILVGLSDKQIKQLPEEIIGIKRTESIHQLAELYSLASVYVNPTYVDNFPTTNIEALACGTPVITYQTGGSPEAIDENTGMVIHKGDLINLKTSIEYIAPRKADCTNNCRMRAVRLFNKNDRFNDYVNLFNTLL